MKKRLINEAKEAENVIDDIPSSSIHLSLHEALEFFRDESVLKLFPGFLKGEKDNITRSVNITINRVIDILLESYEAEVYLHCEKEFQQKSGIEYESLCESLDLTFSKAQFQINDMAILAAHRSLRKDNRNSTIKQVVLSVSVVNEQKEKLLMRVYKTLQERQPKHPVLVEGLLEHIETSKKPPSRSTRNSNTLNDNIIIAASSAALVRKTNKAKKPTKLCKIGKTKSTRKKQLQEPPTKGNFSSNISSKITTLNGKRKRSKPALSEEEGEENELIPTDALTEKEEEVENGEEEEVNLAKIEALRRFHKDHTVKEASRNEPFYPSDMKSVTHIIRPAYDLPQISPSIHAECVKVMMNEIRLKDVNMPITGPIGMEVTPWLGLLSSDTANKEYQREKGEEDENEEEEEEEMTTPLQVAILPLLTQYFTKAYDYFASETFSLGFNEGKAVKDPLYTFFLHTKSDLRRLENLHLMQQYMETQAQELRRAVCKGRETIAGTHA